MKIHFRHLYASLRGIFDPNSVSVAHYASFIGAKSSTKCDVYLAKSNFKTHSSLEMREIMIGLILKDMYVMKRYMKTLLILLIGYIFLGYTMNNILFMGSWLLIIFAMLSITSFSYDDAAKWNNYALTMPIRRIDLVRSKYVLSLLLILAGSVLSLVFSVTLTLAKGSPVTSELFYSQAAVVFIAIFIISAVLPLMIKFGAEKARIMMFIIVMLPSCAVILIGKSGLLNMELLNRMIADHASVLPAAGVLAVLLMLLASYLISGRLIEKIDY